MVMTASLIPAIYE